MMLVSLGVPADAFKAGGNHVPSFITNTLNQCKLGSKSKFTGNLCRNWSLYIFPNFDQSWRQARSMYIL